MYIWVRSDILRTKFTELRLDIYYMYHSYRVEYVFGNRPNITKHHVTSIHVFYSPFIQAYWIINIQLQVLYLLVGNMFSSIDKSNNHISKSIQRHRTTTDLFLHRIISLTTCKVDQVKPGSSTMYWERK